MFKLNAHNKWECASRKEVGGTKEAKKTACAKVQREIYLKNVRNELGKLKADVARRLS